MPWPRKPQAERDWYIDDQIRADVDEDHYEDSLANVCDCIGGVLCTWCHERNRVVAQPRVHIVIKERESILGGMRSPKRIGLFELLPEDIQIYVMSFFGTDVDLTSVFKDAIAQKGRQQMIGSFRPSYPCELCSMGRWHDRCFSSLKVSAMKKTKVQTIQRGLIARFLWSRLLEEKSTCDDALLASFLVNNRRVREFRIKPRFMSSETIVDSGNNELFICDRLYGEVEIHDGPRGLSDGFNSDLFDLAYGINVFKCYQKW